MALIIADRVKETATTTGTGTFTLGGAVTGFRTFNAGIGTGNTTYYCIFLDGTNEFEVGLGTYTAPDQLARDTVLASSNSGSKVNFSQGIKSVFCTQPSSKAAYLDASGNLSISTSNITEGTNLYYTDARFDTRLATKDTADLSEGTNLYYTDARARAAISVSGNAIAYNSSTGVITANFEESPTFTGNVVVSGNLTVTGTTTWLDSTNTQISDKNIVLNYASGDSSANAEGAGITIQDAVDASTDASLTWNATDDNFEISHGLDFGDNSKARFGASQDLQIYHDGSNNASYIKETGAGSLFIEASNLILQREAGTENFIECITNGAVTLFHNGSSKLATTSSGIDVTGGQRIIGDSGDAGSLEIYDVDNGTASTDALRIVKSANEAYIFNRESSGALNLGAGNTLNHVVIASSGNVGIGTTSPAAKLEVAGSVGNFQTTGHQIKLTRNGNNEIYAVGASSVLALGTQDSEDMRIDSSGNVGIGTTSPDEKLDVAGNIVATEQNPYIKIQAGSTGSPNLRFDQDTTRRAFLRYQNAGQFDIINEYGDVTFWTGTSGSESQKMTVKQSGNVGIGTTSPSHELSISKTATGITDNPTLQIINAWTTEGNNVGFSNRALALLEAGNGTVKTRIQTRYDTNANLGEIGTETNHDFRFVTNNIERARINSLGNVGIGTTSPQSKLDVRGDIELNSTFPVLRFKDSDSENDFSIIGGSGLFRIYDEDATASRISVNSSGNVGIGTDSPNQKLEIKTTSGTTGLRIHSDHETAPRTAIEFMRGTTDTFGGDAFTDWKIGHVGSDQADFAIVSSDSNRGTNERVTIEYNTGNVGIGTDSPSRKLTIYQSSGNAVLQLANNISGVGSQDGFLAYTDGTNVGLENKENGYLSLATNAAERARIDSSGNVGIGNTTPSSFYESHLVVGDGAGDEAITVYSGSSNTGYLLFGDATSGNARFAGQVRYDHANNRLEFATNESSTARMAIDSIGRVGIGTTSPDATLELSNGFNAPTLRISNESNIVAAGGDLGIIEFYSGDNSNSGDSVQASLSVIQPTTDNVSGEFVFKTSNAVENSGALTERVRIAKDGKVGIGTDSPSQLLSVSNLSGGASLLIQSNNASSAGNLLFGDNDSDTAGRVQYTHSSNTMALYTNGSEKMTIDSSGNVGIGTTSPLYKLHVQNSGNVALFGDGTRFFRVYTDADEVSLLADGSVPMKFFTSGAEKMRLDTSGNVLIGKTAANIGTNGIQLLPNSFTSFTRTNDSPMYLVRAGSGGSILEFSIGGGGTDSAIGTTGSDDMTFYTGAAATDERMRLTTTGLGIGTGSPSRKLTVQGGSGDNLPVRIIGGASTTQSSMEFQDPSTTADYKVTLGSKGDNLFFQAGGSERARIDSSGNFLVGTTAIPTDDNTTLGFGVTSSGEVRACVNNANAAMFKRATSDGTLLEFRKDANVVGSVSVAGSATTYNTSSDARLKDDIGDFDGLGIVEQLNPRKFAWKSDGQEDIGLYAQEVKELVPNAVSQNEDGYYQMDYSKLVTPLIKAVQELTAKVESLEAQLANK